MKLLVIIAGLFMVSGCAIFSAANSCGAEYQRYKDWKEYLDKAREDYNTNVSTGNLTPEEKQELEVDLIDLQINANDALHDFEDCKTSYLKGKLYSQPISPTEK